MSPEKHSALRPFVERLQSRCPLAPEERQALFDLRFSKTQINANRDFKRELQSVDCSTFVLNGMVGSFKQDRRGHRQVVSVHICGDMVDLHSVPVPQTAAGLQSIVPTTVLLIPHAALRDIASRFPNIALAFWRETVIDAAILMEWVMNVGRRDAHARMAHFLCELAYRSAGSAPSDGAVIPYAITQFAMSDILGLTSVHVNRTLQRLRNEELIDRNERLGQRVLDWDGLARVGDFDPGYLNLGFEPAWKAA